MRAVPVDPRRPPNTEFRVGCTGKVRFTNGAEAQRYIGGRKRQKGDAWRPAHAYACAVCGGWHLTRKDSKP